MIKSKRARFQPPNPEQRLRALGDLSKFPPEFRPLLDLADFTPLNKPRAPDWLASHHERGQTFDQFTSDFCAAPFGRCRVISIQQLTCNEHAGKARFPESIMWCLAPLRAYCTAFFQMDVKYQRPLSLARLEITHRESHYPPHQRQWLTRDIMQYLARQTQVRIREGVFCEIGLADEDLYPGPEWNFVFGEASTMESHGVYSIYRYLPHPYERTSPVMSPEERIAFFKRCCKVMTHELGHIFGLRHCIHHECLMNGSNHLDEFDARPLHLCPVCLRKLHHAVRALGTLDHRARYRGMADALMEGGCAPGDPEVVWLRARLEKLQH